MELVKIKNVNGKQLVSARELHEFLESKERFSKWFERILQFGFEKNIDYIECKYNTIVNNGAKRELQDYKITKDMAKEICFKSRSNSIDVPFVKLGLGDLNQIHTHTRFETSFINMLDEALGEIDVKGIPQYRIDNGKYRIDYYIPSLKLAIEYDEEQHKTKANIKLDKQREKYIIKQLDCKFIRLNYENSDVINLMKVLKEIM